MLVFLLLYLIYALFSVVAHVVVLVFKVLFSVATKTGPALGTYSTLMALMLGLYVVNTAMIDKQDLLFNTVGQAYECTAYPLVYRLTHDDYRPFIFNLLNLRDLYNWLEAPYNAYVTYNIEGFQDAAEEIKGILPTSFASSWDDTWTAAGAVWGFLIHAIRAPTDVPELEVPHLTKPILVYIIDTVTCWLNFAFDFVMSMSELLVLGSCGATCQSLSEQACNCTKLTAGGIAFVPVNEGLYQSFVNDGVDVLCCALDWVIDLAKSVASFNFLKTTPDDGYKNADDLLLAGGNCYKLHLRLLTGDSYTKGFFAPITDGSVDVAVAWLDLALDASRAVITSILFKHPNLDSQLDRLVDKFSNASCQTIELLTFSKFTGIFEDQVEELCDLVDCGAHWSLDLFRALRDGKLKERGLNLVRDGCLCWGKGVKFLWDATQVGNFFSAAISKFVEIVCQMLVAAFRLLHDSLIPGDLEATIDDRIDDLMDLGENILETVTGGFGVGVRRRGLHPRGTGSVIDPVPSVLAEVWGNFMHAFFTLARAVSTGAFRANLSLFLLQFYGSVLSFMNLITDNQFGTVAMPGVVSVTQCSTLAFVDLLDIATPDGPPLDQELQRFFSTSCQCLDTYLGLFFPPQSVFGPVAREFISCQCTILTSAIVETERGTLVSKDCYFCSHPSVGSSSCTPCHSLDTSECRCWTRLISGALGSMPGLSLLQGVTEDLGNALCRLMGTVKLGLGAGLAVAKGDPGAVEGLFQHWVTEIFGSLDDIMNAVSGGVLSGPNSFLLFLADKLAEFIPGLKELLLILNCFLKPVPDWTQRIAGFGGVMDGTKGQPRLPNLGNPNLDRELSTCQSATTLVLPFVQCMSNPLISLLSPFQSLPGSLFFADPTRNPLVLMADKFDMFLECPCELWQSLSSGGSACTAGCFTCEDSVHTLSTDWSKLSRAMKVLSFPFDSISDRTVPLRGPTKINFSPQLLCCLPALFACWEGQKAIAPDGFARGVFEEVGRATNELFEQAEKLVCSLFSFVRFILDFLDLLVDILSSSSTRIIQELKIPLELLQSLVQEILSLLGIQQGKLNILGIVQKGIQNELSNIISLTNSLSKRITDLKGIIQDLADQVKGLFSRDEAHASNRIRDACVFYEDEDTRYAISEYLHEASDVYQQTWRCVEALAMQGNNTRHQLWDPKLGAQRIVQCARERDGFFAKATPIEISECAWQQGIRGMSVYSDYPPSRCVSLLELKSPASMLFGRHEDEHRYRMEEYRVCLAMTRAEESNRQGADVFVAGRVPDTTDTISVLAWFITPLLKGFSRNVSAEHVENMSNHLSDLMKKANHTLHEIGLNSTTQWDIAREAYARVFNKSNSNNNDTAPRNKQAERYRRWRNGLRSHYHARLRRKEMLLDEAVNFTRAAQRDPSLYDQRFGISAWLHATTNRSEIRRPLDRSVTLTEEQRVALSLDAFLRRRYAEVYRARDAHHVRVKLAHARVRREIMERIGGAERNQTERQEALVRWTEEQRKRFRDMKRFRMQERTRTHTAPRTKGNYSAERWFPGPQLKQVHEALELTRASQEQRMFWVQDENDHYGYAVLQPDDPLLESARADKAAGRIPRIPFSEAVMLGEHLEVNASGLQRYRRERRMPPEVPRVQVGVVQHLRKGWEDYNMTHNFQVLRNFSSSLSRVLDWRTVGRMWVMRDESYRQQIRSEYGSFFVFRVHKRSLRNAFTVSNHTRDPRVSPPRRPTRRTQHAILPNTDNRSPFNANEWLEDLFDSILKLLTGQSQVLTGVIASIKKEPIEEDVSKLVDTLVDYAICNRPQDYNGSSYKITCFPNIPHGALDWVGSVPSKRFPRQLWDMVPGITKTGSCTNPVAIPEGNCGAGDGGNRPGCALPVPLRCDWCEQEFHNCKTDIGFTDIGNVLAFSVAAMPRAFNILTHPHQEMGLLGNPSIMIPVAVFFPTWAVFFFNLFVGGTITASPLLQMLFPGAWKFTTVVFVGTLLFDVPRVKWAPLETLRPVFVATRKVVDPWQIISWVISKIDQHNYPNAWAGLPARDTLCYFFTFANLTGLWIVMLLLVLIFGGSFVEIVQGAQRLLVRLVRIVITTVQLWSIGDLQQNQDIAQTRTKRNQRSIKTLEKRVDQLEGLVSQNVTLLSPSPLEDMESGLRHRKHA